MKQVFVHKTTNPTKPYTVIFKDFGTRQEVNDIMIFNAEFKRYDNIKGWHGIVSDEINYSIITLMKAKYLEIKTVASKYYPRLIGSMYPVKHASVIRFLPGSVLIKGTEHVSTSILNEWCRPWNTNDFVDEQPEE
jgi:hypothetical protein